jgi:hypothetical protein
LSIIEQQGNFAALLDEFNLGIGIGSVVHVPLHLASIDSVEVMDRSPHSTRLSCP